MSWDKKTPRHNIRCNAGSKTGHRRTTISAVETSPYVIVEIPDPYIDLIPSSLRAVAAARACLTWIWWRNHRNDNRSMKRTLIIG